MPYSVGLQSAASAFLSAGFASQIALALVAFLFILSCTSAFQKNSPDDPDHLPGSSLFHIFHFFRRRHDFLNWGFYATGQNIYQFKLLQHTVIVVSGESARQKFFTTKGLDLTEGFKILSGAIPMMRGVTSDLATRQIANIHKRLATVQRSGPLSSLMYILLDDTRRIMESWGSCGKFDPFDSVYDLTFQLTVRSLSSTEIAEDHDLVMRLKTLYDRLDAGTTPASVLLPWLPTPAMIKKLLATRDIYNIVTKAIHERKASGKAREDTLQMLLDHEDDELMVVGFVMGLLIAGVRATGTTASWLFIFLGGHQNWRSRAAAEVDSLLDRYSVSPIKSSEKEPSSAKSLASRLSLIPLEAWENEVPVLDAVIRETARIAQPHTAMRRNIGPEIYINNKIIPTNAYVVYPFSDVHLNPDVYPDPWKFDPGRKEVTDIPFAYLGFGGGKTPCLGSRLAKLELKLITAMFVLGFQHSVVGMPTKNLPLPNWNDIFHCRPPAGSFYLQYERNQVPL